MENVIRTYKKGEVIFNEGDFEMSMYDLQAGVVGIYVNYGKENEKLLTELKAENGATFGEMGLLESMPRSATAVALEDIEVCVITEESFGQYFAEKPAAVLMIMQNMSGRIRSLTKDYLEACRAVAEAVETEKNGKEKSGWFREKVNKFIMDYAEAMQIVSQYTDTAVYHSPTYFW